MKTCWRQRPRLAQPLWALSAILLLAGAPAAENSKRATAPLVLAWYCEPDPAHPRTKPAVFCLRAPRPFAAERTVDDADDGGEVQFTATTEGNQTAQAWVRVIWTAGDEETHEALLTDLEARNQARHIILDGSLKGQSKSRMTRYVTEPKDRSGIEVVVYASPWVIQCAAETSNLSFESRVLWTCSSLRGAGATLDSPSPIPSTPAHIVLPWERSLGRDWGLQ